MSYTNLDKGGQKPQKIKLSVGDRVKHGTFGVGKVIALTGGIVSVQFSKETKKFQYPKAIDDGFIVKE